MLKSRICPGHALTDKREAPNHKLSRHITGRRRGKRTVALAMAPIAAAAITLGGLVITAPGASAATACVNRTFSESNTYQPCVVDEQVLLNDLRYARAPGPNQLLTVDGYYGPRTESDAAAFIEYWDELDFDPTQTTPTTWWWLCVVAHDNYGFHGTYWQNAGCGAYANQ